MARVSKMIAEAVRAVIEPLEVRRLLTTVTLTGTGSITDFSAKLNASNGNVDFFVNSSTPVQSVPKEDITSVQILDPNGDGESTFYMDAPGVTLPFDASATSALEVQVQRGGLTITHGQQLGYVYVGPQAVLTMDTGAASLSAAFYVSGQFQHTSGLLNTAYLGIGAGGVFTDAGGSIGSTSGVTIYNRGTFKAAFAGSLAGTTGTFDNGGHFIEDVGAGNTSTIGMSFINNGMSFNLVSGTARINTSFDTYSDLQIDGTGGTLSVPGYSNTGGHFTQTGGTFKVDNDFWVGNHFVSGATFSMTGGVINTSTLYVSAFSNNVSFSQSGGAINASNEAVFGFVSNGGSWSQAGGVNHYSVFTVGTYAATSSTYNLSGGSIVANWAQIGFGGQGTLNISGSGGLTAINETVGSWSGTGTLNQTNGTNNIGSLQVGTVLDGTGYYNLSGGTLTAGEEYIGYDNNQPGATHGTFVQTGGTNTATGTIIISYAGAAYGLYQMSAGTLNVAYFTVGQGASGSFSQSGGQTNVTGNLVVGSWTGDSSNFTLTGGAVHVDGPAFVGFASQGILNHSGGTLFVTNNLYVSGDGRDGYFPLGRGTYNLSGTGTLTASNEFIGYSANATMNQTGGTQTTNYFVYNGPSGTIGTLNKTGGVLNAVQSINVLQPSASGGSMVNEGSPYTLNLSATSSAGNNAISAWAIDWGDQANESFNGNPPSKQHTYNVGGATYTIHATASGGGMSYPAAPKNVFVRTRPPTLVAPGSISKNAGQSATLATTFTYLGIDRPFTARIDWGDGTTDTSGPGGTVTLTQTPNAGSIAASHVYKRHGNYTAILYLEDNSGGIAFVPIYATIAYVAPTFGLSMATTPVVTGQSATLSLKAFGPESDGVTDWTIDWGDGNIIPYHGISTSNTPNQSSWTQTHTYATSGTRTIQATATDSAGSHDAGTLSVTVNPSLKAPTQLVASDVTADGLTLTWKPAVGDEAGFKIYASKDGAAFTMLQSAPASADDSRPVEAALTGLDPSSTYVFKVTAFGTGVESQASQVVLVHTLSSTIRPLSIDGPGQTTVGTPARWTAVGGTVQGLENTLSYVWSVLSSGRSVASGQGLRMNYVPNKAGDYVVQLTAIGSSSGPQVVTQILHVQPSGIEKCIVLGPPISELDRISIFSIDDMRGLDFGPMDGDPPPGPRFDWTVRDTEGHVLQTQSGGWDHSTVGFKFSTLGEITISVVITRTDGRVGYEGSITTTSTIGAPDDYKKAFVDFGTNGEFPDQVIQDHDGNFLVVGTESYHPEYLRFRAGRSVISTSTSTRLELTKRKSDLTADTSWGDNGKMTVDLGPAELVGRQIIRELDDGSFLIAAQTNATLDQPTLVFLKLLPNGSRDNSFGINGIARWKRGIGTLVPQDFSQLEDMAVASDGTIVVSGNVSSSQVGALAAVMRFNSDGTLDDGLPGDSDPSNAFGQHGMAAVSWANFLGPVSEPWAAAPDYHVDWGMGLVIAGDGSIFVGGDHIYTDYRGASPSGVVGREQEIFKLTPNGVLDSNFGTLGNGFLTIPFTQNRTTSWQPEYGNVLLQDSQGRLILVGSSGDGSLGQFGDSFNPGGVKRIIISRILPNGQFDPTFGSDPALPGRVISNFYGSEAGWGASLTPDDKIVVTGPVSYESAPGALIAAGLIARFNVDGSPDTSFGNAGKIILDQEFIGVWQSAIVASDGDIVVAGRAIKSVNGTPVDGFGIAKYRPNDAAARDLTATATTHQTIVLDWVDTGANEDGFVILRSTSATGPANTDLIGLAPKDATTWTDITAIPGKRYYYKVVAFDTSATGTRRLRGETKVASAQVTPKNTSYILQETVAVPVTGSVVESLRTLQAGQNYRFTARGFFAIDGNPDLAKQKKADAQWGLYNPNPSRYGIIGKHVQYGIGINDQTLDLNRFPYWGDPSTDANHTYSIDYSPETSAPVKLNFHDNYYPDNQPGYVMLVDIYRSLPAAPEQVNATVDRAKRRIGVTWKNTAIDADKILLQRSKDGGAFATIATLQGRAETFTDINIAFNSTYAYRLIARNAFGDSDPSIEAVAVMTNLLPQVDFVDPVTIRVGAPVTLQINATDPDVPGSALGYVLTGAPEGTSIDSDGLISGLTIAADDVRTSPEDVGKHYYLGQTLVWKVRVTDEAGGTADRFIALTLAPAESTIPQVAVAPHIVNQTDTSASVSVLGSDDAAESDLTYTWITKHRPFGVPLPTFSDNSTNSAKDTNIEFHAVGTYLFEIRVSDDTGYYGSAELTVVVAPVLSSAQVVDPLVELGANETKDFGAIALDQFQRPWATSGSNMPTFTWQLSAGATVGVIDPMSGVYTAPETVTADQNVGVQVTATLGNISKTANANILLVQAANDPPEIDQDGTEPDLVADPVSFTQIRLTVKAHDPDGLSSDLTYFWETVDPPAGVAAVEFSENGTNAAAETIATCSAAAALNYTFKVTVRDKRNGTTWASIALTDSRNFTKVDLTPKASMLGIGKATTFHAVAKDQYDRQLLVQPAFEWSVDGVVVPGQTTDDFVYTAPAVEGQHTVSVTATSAGVPHSSTAEVSVIGQRPAVMKIMSPSGLADPTVPVLIDRATPIDLVVDDINDDAVKWSLWLTSNTTRLLLADGTKEVGSAPAQGQLVTTLDPTTVVDGLYTLQLIDDTDSVPLIQDQRQVRVTSKFKIGSLRLPFVDAQIQPSSGDPLVATRVYDSMSANVKGDFGYGWSLESNVRPDSFISTARTGNYDDHGVHAYRTGDVVYLTTPDGQQHAFSFIPMKNAAGSGSIAGVVSYSPRFVAVDGSRAELTVPSRGKIFNNADQVVEIRSDLTTGEWFYSVGTGSVSLGYNPSKNEFGRGTSGTDGNSTFTLQTESGTKYRYDQSGRLVDSTDVYGNVVGYGGGTPTGRQFTIRKNSISGLITGISDVPGFSFDTDLTAKAAQYTEYGYNADGELVSVRDRALQTTTFEYEKIDNVSTHRLIRITDSRGVHVATASYNPETHLLAAVADSTGKGTNVASRPIGNGLTGQTAKNAAGEKSEVIYGDHGDVVREIREILDAAGAVTGYQVTQHDYVYGQESQANYKQADTYGVTNINKLFWSIDYAPFVIKGADAVGQRYTLKSTKVIRRVDYKVIDGSSSDPKSDPSLFQPVSVQTLGTRGLETTNFLRYESPGKPAIIENDDHQRAWMLYDAHGNLTSTINALGEGTTTEYDTQGRVIGTYRATADITGPGFRDAGKDLPTVINGQKLSSTTYYTSTNAAAGAYAGKVASTTDEAAQLPGTADGDKLRTLYTYYVGGSADGQVMAVTRVGGGLTQPVPESLTEYDASGRAIKVLDAHGQHTETHYNVFGQVAYTVDAFGGRTASVYDARGQVIRTIYPDGTETRTAYDYLGRAAFTSDRFYSGATITGGVPSAATDTPSLLTRTLYDSLGRATGTERYKEMVIAIKEDGALFKAVPPSATQLALSGRRISSTGTAYDDQGRVSETKDAAGLTTQTEYYANGQVHQTRTVANAAASPWTVYDYHLKDNLPAGTVSYDSITDANGHKTRTYKDALGRVVRTEYADGSFADMAYGPFGSVTKTYDQRKTTDLGTPTYTERQYDLAGRLTDLYLPAVSDALNGNVTTRPHWQYAYDARGNETGQLDPKGRLTSFGYNNFGQRTSRTMPPDGDGNLANDTEHWTYDAFGRMQTHTDFKKQTTAYAYSPDARFGGRLEHEYRFAAGVDALANGSINTIAAAERTDYHYDDLGRQDWIKEYAAGDMATAARTTTYAFDPVTGGMIKVDSATEGVIEHHYHETTGRLDRTWTASSDMTYQYDGQGRLWKVVVTKLNGVTLATPQATTYTYDPVGNLLTTTQDEGTAATADDLVTTDTYDVLNRHDTLTAKVKGVTVFDQDYSYTSDSLKQDVLEHRYNASGALNGTVRMTWDYADDGRLTTETRDEGDDHVQNGGDYTDTFAFDLSGNRAAKTHDAVGTAGDVVTTSTYNERNELTSTTTNGGTLQAATYDANGNTLTDGSTVYTWDLRNRMLSVTTAGVTTTYTYDASGVRVSKTTDGTKTTFLNDAKNFTGYAKPVEEWVGGTLSRTYIIGITVLGQADATGSITDILRDGRGYARSLVASGVVIQNVDYGAYGDPQNGVTPATAAASPDGYRDVETGSYYQNARFRLDGRWLSQDDITQTAGDYSNANLFSFVGGNPLSWLDPSGHEGILSVLSVSGIQSSLSSMHQIGFSAVAKTVEGVGNGLSTKQVLTSFLFDQAKMAALFGVAIVGGSLFAKLRDGSLFVPGGGFGIARLLPRQGGSVIQAGRLASKIEGSQSVSELIQAEEAARYTGGSFYGNSTKTASIAQGGDGYMLVAGRRAQVELTQADTGLNAIRFAIGDKVKDFRNAGVNDAILFVRSPSISAEELTSGLLAKIDNISSFVGNTFREIHVLTADGWISLLKE